jgi:CspA family cold shock protein
MVAALNREHGRVVWFDVARGFGFLSSDNGGRDIFCHVSQVPGELPLERGDRVSFVRVKKNGSHVMAMSVQLI